MADVDLSNSGSGSDNSGIESPDPDSRSVSPVENVDISSGSEKQPGPGPALKASKKGTDGGSTDKPHPTTAQMVNTALAQLNDKKGSSLSAIKKFIADNYKLEVTKQFATRICKHLNSGVEKGLVIRTKGAGANGSFKLVENKDVKPKPKPTKTKAAAKKAKPEVENKEKKAPSTVGESSTKENNIKTNKPSAKPLAASSKKQLPPASAAAVSSSKKTAAKPTTATENKAPAKPIKSPAKNVANTNPSLKSPKGATLQSKAEKPESPKAVVKPKSPKAKVLLTKTKPPKAVAKPISPKNPVKAKPSNAPKAK